MVFSRSNQFYRFYFWGFGVMVGLHLNIVEVYLWLFLSNFCRGGRERIWQFWNKWTPPLAQLFTPLSLVLNFSISGCSGGHSFIIVGSFLLYKSNWHIFLIDLNKEKFASQYSCAYWFSYIAGHIYSLSLIELIIINNY